MNKRFIAAAFAGIVGITALAGCASDSDRVSENISKEAESFRIDRSIYFYNGITNEILLTVKGKCSIDQEGKEARITCKTGPDAFYRNSVYLSDNVTYVSEQTETVDVSDYAYEVIIKPESIVPDFVNESSTFGGK